MRYDFILLVRGDGLLSLERFETIPTDEEAWGWLLPDDAQLFRFTLGRPCDIMLVDASSEEFDVSEDLFSDGPRVQLWPKPGRDAVA